MKNSSIQAPPFGRKKLRLMFYIQRSIIRKIFYTKIKRLEMIFLRKTSEKTKLKGVIEILKIKLTENVILESYYHI